MLKIMYICPWGIYSKKYDGMDMNASKPIHEDMSIAPPWAWPILVKKSWFEGVNVLKFVKEDK